MYSSLCINSNCNVFLKQLIDKTHTQKMQCHVLSFTLKRKKQCFPGAHASSFVLLSNILCHLLLPPICSYLYQHIWAIQTCWELWESNESFKYTQTGTAELEERQAAGYDRHSKGLAAPTVSLMFISANMLIKAKHHQTTPCGIHPCSNIHPKS